MVKIFTECSERTILKLEKLLGEQSDGVKTVELDLEAEFSSLALDIIGLGVFNYNFGSVTKESPVIKVRLTEALFYSSIVLPIFYNSA